MVFLIIPFSKKPGTLDYPMESEISDIVGNLRRGAEQ
jgi:hypothetical protein